MTRGGKGKENRRLNPSLKGRKRKEDNGMQRQTRSEEKVDTEVKTMSRRQRAKS